MNGWHKVPLERVAKIDYGTRVTRKKDVGSTYPVYGGGGATFLVDDWNREDCLIVSRFAMSEECVRYVPGRFFLNDSGLTVSTRDEKVLSQRFLDAVLISQSQSIYGLGRGTAQRNLNVKAFREFLIPLPSLRTQSRVVAHVDEIFDEVGRLSSNLIGKEEHLQKLWASLLAEHLESNLRGCQQGLSRVGDIATIVRRPAKISDLGRYELWSLPSFERGEPERVLGSQIKSGKFALKPGDVLLGKINPRINRVWVVAASSGYGTQVGSTEWIVLEPDEGQVDKDYLAYSLRSREFRVAFTSSVTGATGSHTRGKPQAVLDYLVCLPPVDEQRRIVDALRHFEAELSRVKEQISAQRSSLVEFQASALDEVLAGMA